MNADDADVIASARMDESNQSVPVLMSVYERSLAVYLFSLRVQFSVLVLAAAFCFTPFAHSAAPTLDHIFPVAVPSGSTNSVQVIGKFEPWPPKVWVDAPGIVFKAETNSGKFTVEIATNAPVGPHLIRVFNEQGASGPRFLIVTRAPQSAEREPNDNFTKPQMVETLPASINGRLEKGGDVDSFAVALEAGQTLIASLEAYTLASPVDAVLRVVDARGVQVAFNHDDGRSLDPFLAWTAKSAGSYVVQVFGFSYPAGSEVRFAGGNAIIYRLHLSRGPYLRYTLPLGVQRGARTQLQLFGWNQKTNSAREFTFDGSGLATNAREVVLKIPEFENEITLPIGDGPELMEKEPNNATNETMIVNPPGAVTGCIDKPGDEDRFGFVAKKGDGFLFQVQSAALGFPVDAWLKIEDAKGKELAKGDDGANADPMVEWSASEDGTYVARVGNVLHRGGPDYLYRLSIQAPLPALQAVVANHAFTIEPGKTNEIKVTLKRLNGLQSKLSVAVKGLPDGLKAEPTEVPDKGTDVTVKLVAAPDAKPCSGPLQFILTETGTGKVYLAIHELVTSSINNGVPSGYSKLAIETTDQFWLTVLPVPAAKVAGGK